MSNSDKNISIESLFKLEFGTLWSAFRAEGLAFFFICGYFFCEYVRPQSIISGLDFLPWTQLTIVLSAMFWAAEGKFGGRITTPSNYLMVLYYIVIVLSSMAAFNSQISYKLLSNFYLWLIIFYLIQVIVTNEKRFLIFLLIFLLASFKLSLFGAKTWAMRGFAFTSWGIRGPPGFFTNSGELAAQMCVFFGVSYYFYEVAKKYISGWRLWMVRLFPITAAMTVMAASSRGAQLALLVQGYFVFLHGKVSMRSLFLVTAFVGLLYVALPAEQLERFQSAGDDRTSEQRLLYWEHGFDMMLEYPLLGVGYFNFPTYYNHYYPQDLLYESAELAHNIFVQVGADLGFLGLFIYLLLIWQGFKIPSLVRQRLIKQGLQEDWRIPISKGLAVGFLGFLIAGQFVSIVYYPYMWIHLALCCALLNTTVQAVKKA